jgi:hypothetical protein
MHRVGELPSPFPIFLLMAFSIWSYFMSKQAKLLSYLQSGAQVTAKQIAGTFGLKNPYDAIHQLRARGHCIYSNRSKLSDGTATVKYKIGAPSKRMVAIANAVMGASAFTAQRTR